MAAWTEWHYKHSPRLYYDVGSPHAYAVIAIKRELRYLGYEAIGFDTEKPVLGLQADVLIKKFQSAMPTGPLPSERKKTPRGT